MTLGKLIQLTVILSFMVFGTSCSEETPILQKTEVTGHVESTTGAVSVKRVPQGDSSKQVLHGLGLNDYDKVAKQIFLVKESMSEEFPVGDGLTFTMYILRYLAEVGDYVLTNEDISNLIVAFEKISGEKLDDTIYETVSQIKSLKFGKKGGEYSVIISANHKNNGILIPINEVSDEGMVQEIQYAKITDQSQIVFRDVDTKSKIKALNRFLTEKITIPLISETVLPPLNQLHKDIKHDIESYLEETEIIPLEIKTEGIFIKVDTSTVFNKMKFYLRTLYTLPGRKKNGNSIPSLVMRIRAKLVNVKLSIDQ